ncbi:MAG TPA: hypothetical protein PLV92_27200, partial [Pirellulaceae bacterium]|nr:hypothetical protein [Pirellulaceae bacterium]
RHEAAGDERYAHAVPRRELFGLLDHRLVPLDAVRVEAEPCRRDRDDAESTAPFEEAHEARFLRAQRAQAAHDQFVVARDRAVARRQVGMREVRGEVLKNPLLSKLRSDRNPFGGEKVMAALAYVRASLKRIELAALEGV